MDYPALRTMPERAIVIYLNDQLAYGVKSHKPFVTYSFIYLVEQLRLTHDQRNSRMSEAEQSDLTTLTVQLLSAYVANNSVANDDLAALIQSTRAALAGISTPEEPAAPVFTPAVGIRKSLSSPDHIISMIDGKQYKTLKRHLGTHGLSPAEYRERYNLPKDYPLVAPSYSEQRRETAARIGLGRKRAAPKANAEVAAPVAAKKVTAAKPVKAKASTARPGETDAAANAPSVSAEPKVKILGTAKGKVPAAKAPRLKKADAASPLNGTATPATASATTEPETAKAPKTVAAKKASPRAKLKIAVSGAPSAKTSKRAKGKEVLDPA
jgi:predicted transcriptional regulator